MILVRNKYKKMFEFTVVMCMYLCIYVHVCACYVQVVMCMCIRLVLLLIFNKIISHFMQVNEKQTPHLCKKSKTRYEMFIN